MTDIIQDIAIAFALWLAMTTYVNTRLDAVDRKLNRLLEAFDGLREYLYEIDPQFDDERESGRAFAGDAHIFAGLEDMELLREKKKEGFRTLSSPFFDTGFRSPRDR